MRYVKTLILGLLFSSASAHASFLVQQKFASASHAPAATFASNVTAGNTLVVIVDGRNSTPTCSGGGVTWVQDTSKVVSGASIQILHGLNATGGSTTITCTENNSNFAVVDMVAVELSITGSTNPLDASNTNNAQSTTATPGSITPTSSIAEFIIVGGFSRSGVNTTTGFNGGFTDFAGADTGAVFTAGYLDTASTSGSYNPSRGTGNTFDNWIATITSFKQPGGAASKSLTPSYGEAF
jgi:hypothetical protein